MSIINLYIKTKFDCDEKYLDLIFKSIIGGDYKLKWSGNIGYASLFESETQYIKLNQCYDAISSDLQDDVSMIVVPYIDSSIEEEIRKINRTGLFYFTEELPKLLNADIFIKDKLLSFEHELNEDILTTIKIYLQQNMSVNQTARIMFTHRNTINYRINRFIELTGIDIRDTQNGYYVYLLITW